MQKGKKKKSIGKKLVMDKSPVKEVEFEKSKATEKKKKKIKYVKMGLNKKLREKNVEKDVSDILGGIEEEAAHDESLSLAIIRSIVGQKLPTDIPPAPSYNISFHEEDQVRKWRYVITALCFLRRSCLRKL